MIRRYSSRIQQLDQSFLNEKLNNAIAYDRIAGYFSSSMLEVAGEAIENIEKKVRIVCNSDLAVEDVETASAAQNAMRREWCGVKPEKIYSNTTVRLKKLYDLLTTQKIEIRVIPNSVFGLIHGKAGIITFKDGIKTCFVGSVNETSSGWKYNYELLWEDDSFDAVDWVQEEFDFFWNSPCAVPLSSFIIHDIARIINRKVIDSVEDWNKEPEPAPIVIESPVYRQEFGLWEHQKYFVNLAFNHHKQFGGARFVLADMVGLGKTVQMALSAQLMALYGDKPVLIIAPKTLLWQWQEEMKTLLDMPSAVWTGKEWIDENGIKYPSIGDISIKKCPRRVGIISQGLISARSDMVQHILALKYECVIVDECHRARRKNIGSGKESQKPDPNNLMSFLLDLSRKTKSMLIATATPVQMYPIEAWDLLYILSQGNDSVMGNNFSMWRKHSDRTLNMITGNESPPESTFESWNWLRNPFPPASENPITFGQVRNYVNMKDDEFVIKPEAYQEMSLPKQAKVKNIIQDNFFTEHNPFIRHIVRRTREYLETTLNPETKEPYLKAVKVKLFGEKDDESITLPPYLYEAYIYAEEFSELLKKRIKGGGFIKTLLLKRVGSTMIAGENTARKMLSNWGGLVLDDEYEDDETAEDSLDQSDIKNISEDEKNCLIKFVHTLEANKERDPKYQKVYDLLIHDKWIDRGCLVFSQYYDSAYWIAEHLSNDLPNEKIGIYAGGDKSGVFLDGIYSKQNKESIKQMVKNRELRLLIGTDAASEGLNLQTLGTLINLDLPWNPTRLEQRKGRIQRIGQVYDEVYIYNMRYKGSVEDRVHSLLSERLENIHNMFGQLPDVLEDVWIDVALNDIEQAKKKIDSVPKQHPFAIRYQENVGAIDWESCVSVLDKAEKTKHFLVGWNNRS